MSRIKPNVQIINKSSNPTPKYARSGDVGMDLMADFTNGFDDSLGEGVAWDDESKCLRIFSGGRCLVPTGIYTSFDEGYELQIRSRSGRSIKEGLIVLNAPGTIDPGYRDEIKIIIMNLGSEPVEIYQGDRIAQMVLNKIEFIKWCEVEILEGENRGGGFGSTGNK